MGKCYSKKELDFLKEFYPKFGLKFCIEKLDRDSRSIKKKVSNLNLSEGKLNNFEEIIFKNNVFNCSLDNIDNKYLVYWLGFFWADGYIRKKSELVIKIVEEDGENLKNIFNNVADWNITYRKQSGRRDQIIFQLTDQSVCCKLYELGKYPNTSESHEKVFKLIPEHLHNYFFRGLIDGDGNFYLSKDWGSRQFSISGNFEQDWSFLINYLEKLNIIANIKRTESEKGNSSSLRVTNKESLKNLINFLYNERDEVYLDRKLFKADEIMYSIDNAKNRKFLI